ncbi:MAG: hypothetical protein ABW040_10895 [Microbacteriaceae bacterium]
MTAAKRCGGRTAGSKRRGRTVIGTSEAEAGRVVDAGPEAQVARPGGPYDRLWRVQEDELAGEKDRELAGG